MIAHPVAGQDANASTAALELRRTHGTVTVMALGREQFSVRAPAHDEEIVPGFDAACERARRLARGLE
jgi:hypothetical protein